MWVFFRDLFHPQSAMAGGFLFVGGSHEAGSKAQLSNNQKAFTGLIRFHQRTQSSIRQEVFQNFIENFWGGVFKYRIRVFKYQVDRSITELLGAGEE